MSFLNLINVFIGEMSLVGPRATLGCQPNQRIELNARTFSKSITCLAHGLEPCILFLS